MTRRQMLVVSLACAASLWAATSEAQDVALRFYVVPKDGDGTFLDKFRPKYIADLGVPWQAMDYGLEDTFLVGTNVTNAQHTSLASNIDVVSVPQNIDATIGLSALTTVQERLEGLHIPAGWVNTSHTYRDVLRVTGRIFKFMQRFHAMHNRVMFQPSITLETRMNELTQAQRNAVQATADSFSLDTSAVGSTTTVRQVLKLIADQMPAFVLAGEVF